MADLLSVVTWLPSIKSDDSVTINADKLTYMGVHQCKWPANCTLCGECASSFDRQSFQEFAQWNSCKKPIMPEQARFLHSEKERGLEMCELLTWLYICTQKQGSNYFST